MIKKISFILLLLTLLFPSIISSNTNAYYEPYYFDAFNVDVVVDEDYTFHITETINVVFTEERHGIYRTLPKYWGEERIKYTDINVSGAPFLIENDVYATDIRIGDANKKVLGDITYTISYTVNLPKDPSNEMDAVYINLIGHDNPTYTNNSDITITLPKKVDPSAISVVSGYYYDYGLEDKILYEYTDRQVLKIHLTEPLESYEGITAKINLPQGYFQNVRAPFFWDEFLKVLIPIIFVIIGLIIWMKYGNDEKVIIPIEVSPPDANPIEAGYIIDGVVNDDDIATMIIYWASLGFIKIEKAKGRHNYNFYKIKEIEGRPQYEQQVFHGIFTRNNLSEPIDTDTLKKRLSKNVSTLRNGVKRKYNKGTNKLIDKKSKTFSGLVAFIAYICFSLIGFFYGYYYHIGTGIFFAILSLMLFVPMHLILKQILKYVHKRLPAQNIIRFAIFSLVILLYAYIASNSMRPWILNFTQILVILASACILIVISFYTQKLSDKGHETFERVLGFRHFMITAEKDWLEELAADTPEYFYNTLPYALVLGVSRVWIGKFAKTIQVEPDWYSTGNTSKAFQSRTFSSNLVSDFSKIGTSSVKMYNQRRSVSSGYSSSRSSYSYRPSSSFSSSSSRSSFSSSGSSSGGGFGGGGSRSW